MEARACVSACPSGTSVRRSGPQQGRRANVGRRAPRAGPRGRRGGAASLSCNAAGSWYTAQCVQGACISGIELAHMCAYGCGPLAGVQRVPSAPAPLQRMAAYAGRPSRAKSCLPACMLTRSEAPISVNSTGLSLQAERVPQMLRAAQQIDNACIITAGLAAQPWPGLALACFIFAGAWCRPAGAGRSLLRKSRPFEEKYAGSCGR